MKRLIRRHVRRLTLRGNESESDLNAEAFLDTNKDEVCKKKKF